MRYHLDKINSNYISGFVLMLLLVATGPVAYAQNSTPAAPRQTISENAKDAWIQGKLESAYSFNQHLNPFEINVSVTNGAVTLNGTVESDIDRDLAGEIAKGVDEVTNVKNNLQVVSGTRDKLADANPGKPSFKQFVIDASITATVISKLIANNNTSVMDIKVNTEYGVVSLKGKVDSEQEKQLAEELAKNSYNVRDVKNELIVASM